MGDHKKLILLCFRQAWRGSISFANGWAPLVGGVALFCMARKGWLPLNPPDGWWGIPEIGLMSLGAAWIVVFAARLVSAPYFLHLEAIKKTQSQVMPALSFGLLGPQYQLTDNLSATTVRRWACVILRNIGQQAVDNILVYAEAERDGSFTDSDKVTLSDKPLKLNFSHREIIRVASREETTDKEFVQEGGHIILYNQTDLGNFAFYSNTIIKLQAVSGGILLCEEKFKLYLGPLGTLSIGYV